MKIRVQIAITVMTRLNYVLLERAIRGKTALKTQPYLLYEVEGRFSCLVDEDAKQGYFPPPGAYHIKRKIYEKIDRED